MIRKLIQKTTRYTRIKADALICLSLFVLWTGKTIAADLNIMTNAAMDSLGIDTGINVTIDSDKNLDIGEGGLSISQGGTLTAGSGTISTEGDWNNSGDFYPNLSTVLLDGNKNQTIYGTYNFYDLVIDNAIENPNVNPVDAPALTITGTLYVLDGRFNLKDGSQINSVVIGSEGILFPDSAMFIPVYLNWMNSGSFPHNNSSVILSGSNQYISGNTTFYKLFKNVSTADTLTFEKGSVQIIENELSLQGSRYNLLTLQSDIEGIQFHLVFTGDTLQTLNNLKVKDSDASGGNTLYTYYSIDSGNNNGWYFFNYLPELTPLIVETMDYLENDSLIINDEIAINDLDDDSLLSATIKVADNYNSIEDTLLFFPQSGISAGYFSDLTGLLTLTGHASVNEYQTALRSVEYLNISDDPVENTRTISFWVYDGKDNSNIISTKITVAKVNDPPVITSSDSVSGTEDISFKYYAAATDPDDTTLTFTFNGLPSWLDAGVDSVYGTPTEGILADSFRIIVSDGVLQDTVTVKINITAVNDAPVIVGLQDTTIYITENNSLYFTFQGFIEDVDDSLLTLILSLIKNTRYPTSDSLNILPGTRISNFDTVLFKPKIEWSDSALIQLIVADSSGLADTAQFVIDVIRVLRPHLAVSVIQNNAFSNYFELVVIDTVDKVKTLILKVQNEEVILDTIADYTFLGHHNFTVEGTYDIDVKAVGIVGDTSITRQVGMILAKKFDQWSGSSPDGLFRISGSSGTVTFDQPILVVDSSMFEPLFRDQASYRLGNESMTFEKSVGISITDSRDEIAIYHREDGFDWVELPSLTVDGQIMTYTDKMGYFRLGAKTLIVPEITSLHQNYPNPFNPVTNIDYEVGFWDGPNQKINLSIYNLLGQHVKTLVDEQKDVGHYTIQWNGQDKRGIPVSSGLYFVQMSTNMGKVQSKKLMVLR